MPYFEKFCTDYGFSYRIVDSVTENSVSEKAAYLVIRHSDLVDIIQIFRKKGFTLGQHAGIVIYNDEPFFEIIDNGITAISTDFRQIGALAAEYILTRKKIQTYVPTRLIVRGSL